MVLAALGLKPRAFALWSAVAADMVVITGPDAAASRQPAKPRHNGLPVLAGYPVPAETVKVRDPLCVRALPVDRAAGVLIHGRGGGRPYDDLDVLRLPIDQVGLSHLPGFHFRVFVSCQETAGAPY